MPALEVYGFRESYIAPAFGVAAYFMALQAVGKVSALWQFFIFILSGAILGYSVSLAGGCYILTFCLLLCPVTYSIRYLLHERIGHTRFLWLEPLLYAITIGLYVIGNLKEGMGWISWVYPIPTLANTSFKMVGLSIDMKDFTALTKAEYGVHIGKMAPGFTLSDQDGKQVSLSYYKDKQHVLVIFVRGDWCPTCHIMLRTYERRKDEFAKKNIAVLAIGPDPVGVNLDMVKRLGVDYKLLSDDKNEAAVAYGMMFQKNNPFTKYKVGVPLPAAFLIDKKGTLVFTSNPKNPGEILKPETIFPVIDKLGVA